MHTTWSRTTRVAGANLLRVKFPGMLSSIENIANRFPPPETVMFFHKLSFLF
jgi:hypothetical protein